MYRNILIRVIVIEVIWVILGVLFYHYIHGWRLYDAFNYEVNIGLSIGFSGLTELENDGVHFFSMIYELFGTCLLLGSFTALVNYELCMKQPLLPPVYTFNTVTFVQNGKVTLSTIFKSLKYRIEFIFGAYSSESMVAINIFLTALIVSGIIFGMKSQDWSFIKSVFFSFNIVNTAGILGPNCFNTGDDANGNCSFGEFPAVFTGLLGLIGIPGNCNLILLFVYMSIIRTYKFAITLLIYQ